VVIEGYCCSSCPRSLLGIKGKLQRSKKTNPIVTRHLPSFCFFVSHKKSRPTKSKHRHKGSGNSKSMIKVLITEYICLDLKLFSLDKTNTTGMSAIFPGTPLLLAAQLLFHQTPSQLSYGSEDQTPFVYPHGILNPR